MRSLAIDEKGQQAAFAARLIRDAMVADTRGNRNVNADAGRKAAVGVGDRIGCRDWPMTRLDLPTFEIAQKRGLAPGLDVVALADDSVDLSVAGCGAVVALPDLPAAHRPDSAPAPLGVNVRSR